MDYAVECVTPRGRPKKTWSDVTENDCQTRELCKEDGCLPASQKRAIITPLLKKPSLDAGEPKNHRPVSNLTFMSKVIERIVAEQLVNLRQVPSSERPHAEVTVGISASAFYRDRTAACVVGHLCRR